MKWFISQPMRGKSNDEIKEERNNIIASIKKLDPNAQVIDSFFKNAPHEANPVWFLSKSISLLADADAALFANDFGAARGCRIELTICKEYGIPYYWIDNAGTMVEMR